MCLGAGEVFGAPASGHQDGGHYNYDGEYQVCFVHGECGVFQLYMHKNNELEWGFKGFRGHIKELGNTLKCHLYTIWVSRE